MAGMMQVLSDASSYSHLTSHILHTSLLYPIPLHGKVGRNFQKNYIPAFRKAAIIIASHSLWGGHHHVEVHDDAYWIEKFTMFGFIYSPGLTEKFRKAAEDDNNMCCAPNGVKLRPQHLWLTGLIFINPAVAALPQHAHLLAEPGCYDQNENGTAVHRECGQSSFLRSLDHAADSVLPESSRALPLTRAQDEAWVAHIKPLVKQKSPDGG